MEPLGTLAHKLFVARAAATEDTLLDLTTKGDFAQKPATALDLLKMSIAWSPEVVHDAPVRPILKQNGIAFLFCGSTAHSKTFEWHLKAWRNENSPCKYVAAGAGVTGTQEVIVYPHLYNPDDATSGVVANMFWADTLTVSWWNWFKEVKSTDITGHNSVAEIWTDDCGYRYWLVEIITTGTATPATVVAVYYGYF